MLTSSFAPPVPNPEVAIGVTPSSRSKWRPRMFWWAGVLKLCACESSRLAGARTVKSYSSLNDVATDTVPKELNWKMLSLTDSGPILKTVAEAGAAPTANTAAKAAKAVRMAIARFLNSAVVRLVLIIKCLLVTAPPHPVVGRFVANHLATHMYPNLAISAVFECEVVRSGYPLRVTRA